MLLWPYPADLFVRSNHVSVTPNLHANTEFILRSVNIIREGKNVTVHWGKASFIGSGFKILKLLFKSYKIASYKADNLLIKSSDVLLLADSSSAGFRSIIFHISFSTRVSLTGDIVTF